MDKALRGVHSSAFAQPKEYRLQKAAGKHRYQLPLSTYSSGLYIVRLVKGNKPAAQLKLIHTTE